MFAERNRDSFEMLSKYTKHSDIITHLVIDTVYSDDGSFKKVKRTLKYLCALLDGAWIVSYKCMKCPCKA